MLVKKQQYRRNCILFLLHNILFLTWDAGAAATSGTGAGGGQTHFPVHIGVVLDLNSTIGSMADVCISVALEDFYSEHSDYHTRLFLHTKDAQQNLDMASEG